MLVSLNPQFAQILHLSAGLLKRIENDNLSFSRVSTNLVNIRRHSKLTRQTYVKLSSNIGILNE